MIKSLAFIVLLGSALCAQLPSSLLIVKHASDGSIPIYNITNTYKSPLTAIIIIISHPLTGNKILTSLKWYDSAIYWWDAPVPQYHSITFKFFALKRFPIMTYSASIVAATFSDGYSIGSASWLGQIHEMSSCNIEAMMSIRKLLNHAILNKVSAANIIRLLNTQHEKMLDAMQSHFSSPMQYFHSKTWSCSLGMRFPYLYAFANLKRDNIKNPIVIINSVIFPYFDKQTKRLQEVRVKSNIPSGTP